MRGEAPGLAPRLQRSSDLPNGLQVSNQDGCPSMSNEWRQLVLEASLNDQRKLDFSAGTVALDHRDHRVDPGFLDSHEQRHVVDTEEATHGGNLRQTVP